MMEDLCEEVYRIRKKEYVYKRDSQGRLTKEKKGGNSADRDVESAVKTFRQKQFMASKLSIDFWK